MNEKAIATPPSKGDPGPYRILSLDGGGAKGFYTLGVLEEIEAMVAGPLHGSFDLIYGTSTGAIIASLLALGMAVKDIHTLYQQHVPQVMAKHTRGGRTEALARLSREVFGDADFKDVKTGIGIVASRWFDERPMIFKAHSGQAHGSRGTWVPGFGVSVADAVQASCSAFPFFAKKVVKTSHGDVIELIDGGFCANNPTLYAIADATAPAAMNKPQANLRVVSIGVGVYPPKKRWKVELLKKVPFNSIALLQKTLEMNTQSMEQLRSILFKNVATIRINQEFKHPELATDLLEHNLTLLNQLRQRGRQSFRENETNLRSFLI